MNDPSIVLGFENVRMIFLIIKTNKFGFMSPVYIMVLHKVKACWFICPSKLGLVDPFTLCIPCIANNIEFIDPLFRLAEMNSLCWVIHNIFINQKSLVLQCLNEGLIYIELYMSIKVTIYYICTNHIIQRFNMLVAFLWK